MEWQNMRYSQEFKDNVAARLLSKELSISEAVEQYSIGKSTISYWLKIAREQAGCGTLPNKGNPKLMASLKLPKGVTYLQAHTAVVAREIMSETDFGQFCRKHGYLASAVDAWAEWFNNHPDVVDKKLHDAQMSAMSELKKENARKNREIARKDKALADAATMLMLSTFRWSNSVNRKACRRGNPARQSALPHGRCRTGGMHRMVMAGSTAATLRARGKSLRTCVSRS